MQNPFIPSQDAQFALFLATFASLLTATPANYNLTAPDAAPVQAAADSFATAFGLATDPATRTSATIAAKDAARALATAIVRPVAVGISRDPAVSDVLKVGLGVNLPNTGRTPIPAPTTQPVISHLASTHLSAALSFRDAATPTSKAKPPGVTGLELRQTIGTAPAVSPDMASPLATLTKSPNSVTFASGDVGKVATIWGRWTTRSGPAGVAQSGPWSTPISFGII